MSKVWVLETSTKGTGANVVPLERVLEKPPSAPEPLYVPPKRPPRPVPAPEARPPRRFKVVDLMTRQVLGEDATTRETVEILRDVRSVVDVNVLVWHPDRDRWRMLTTAEQSALWKLRDAPTGVPQA
ncbi:MAG TPA: hypothetical protein VGH24_13485 [Solirubrobacteraceae bacterium]|jgi:hypothetical protein